MKKDSKWIKKRHSVFTALARVCFGPIARRMYRAKPEPFKEQGKRPYLVLYNHQTPFDQFFVGLSFSGPIYYVATEDIFSLGFASSLLRFAVAPIPIVKSTTDLKAVKTCIRVAKEGGTIAIAPEGNRTYSGKTEYINPAIASLAKKLGLPIALYRIEGGYGVEPRWSDRRRKGAMRSYVSRVIEPEEAAAMSNDELMNAIREGLYINEGSTGGTFRSDRKAEYLERAVYWCPYCGLSKFESDGNEIACQTCGRRIVYGEDKRLTGVGFDFPFGSVAEWYDAQSDFIGKLDLSAYTDKPLFTDTADLYDVELGRRKKLIRKGVTLRLYGDRAEIDADESIVLPFETLRAATVLGRNKLNLYAQERTWQLRGDKRFNALKYVNICYSSKNIDRGDKDGKFLGL
ncbi:MAG: 1-acyl-sn-glycerol-3-phosphate acyltransferase [Clostridia bacterium]|nr:1-acyl-sn-glycerol-3-phosphate acyltransferase [Clostridia bacterium]